MSDYKVKYNKLYGSGVEYHDTKKKGGIIKPKYLVLHYTVGTNFDSDVRVLSSSSIPASCHIVIGPEGQVAQIGGALNRRLWHAGKSYWKGLSGLNSYSIGIEVTCPGPVKPLSDGRFMTALGSVIENGKPWRVIEAKHKNGSQWTHWAVFTEKQVERILDIGSAIMAHYNIEEAVGHDMIAPRRKIDPGPSMPDAVLARLNGRREDKEDAPMGNTTGAMYIVRGTDYEGLNFRVAPSGRRVGSLPENTIVEKLDVDGNWFKVKTPAGYIGWVYSSYLKKVE